MKDYPEDNNKAEKNMMQTVNTTKEVQRVLWEFQKEGETPSGTGGKVHLLKMLSHIKNMMVIFYKRLKMAMQVL